MDVIVGNCASLVSDQLVFFFTTLQIARSRIKTILDQVAPSSLSNKILELDVFITTLITSSQIAY